MFLTVFTLAHIALSLIGVGSGLTIMYGLLAGKRVDEPAAIFFLATAATSVMGFGFPSIGFTSAQFAGILSLYFLALAIDGWYDEEFGGPRRWIYLITATLCLYLNVSVSVSQAFEKVALLSGIAPTQAEPPFVLTQLIVTVLFAALGVLAAKRFPRVPQTRNFG
jgi:hypothetical protein